MGKPFAICNAGGGFAYVGAMQDRFPHALTLSRQGYNAFVLIYPYSVFIAHKSKDHKISSTLFFSPKKTPKNIFVSERFLYIFYS